MFGITQQQIIDEYLNSPTAKMCGVELVIAGVLSDAQEMIERNQLDQARKNINIAKFILFEMRGSPQAQHYGPIAKAQMTAAADLEDELIADQDKVWHDTDEAA